MSLKEFLQNEKNERKKRHLAEKKAKKDKKRLRTPEQKRMRVYGIIFTLFVVFGSLFFSCKGLFKEDFDWNIIMGISDSMIEKLEDKVDKTELIDGVEINNDDWTSCKLKFSAVGVNLEEYSGEENIVISQDFSINNRELGALANNMLGTLKLSSFQVLELKIYSIGEDFYQRTVALIDLSNYVLGAKLPCVYLTTTSKFDVLSERLSIIETETTINKLSLEESQEMFEVLNKTTIMKLDSIVNQNIFLCVNSVSESLGTDMNIKTNEIIFRK